MQETLFIDEFGPLPLTRPGSPAEVGDLVRQAASARQGLYPLGGRTTLSLGRPPQKPGLAVDLRGLDQVIDYPARDMTITVQAGITLARLQEVLGAENQRLPVDVPFPNQATLGGAMAANVSGLRRYGVGTLRDYVIGITTVNDEGQETRAGGRVVKNVAGYDLCKLHIGALGTLGIITQATLKVRPRAEQQALVFLGCSTEQLELVLNRLDGSRTRPVCLEVLNRQAAAQLQRQPGVSFEEAPWMVVVGFEDNHEATTWEIQQLSQEMNEASVTFSGPLKGPEFLPALQAMVDLPGLADSCLTFKANLLPSATAAFCRLAEGQGGQVLLQAHAGNGIVVGHVLDPLSLEQAQVLVQSLQGFAVSAQGNLVLWRCPPSWKTTLPVWGKAREDARIMRNIKEKFDPGWIFNPGRFIEGI